MEYYRQGSVLLAPDPHDVHEERPVVVISDVNRIHLGDEYTIATLTTQDHLGERTYARRIPYQAVEEGRLRDPRGSFVCPWATYVVEADHLNRRIAVLSDAFMQTLAAAYSDMIDPTA
jgi:mRNA-degrading endonuclease toxin of MazEF toxin-antitoxin module